jgi:hypothetical protein
MKKKFTAIGKPLCHPRKIAEYFLLEKKFFYSHELARKKRKPVLFVFSPPPLAYQTKPVIGRFLNKASLGHSSQIFCLTLYILFRLYKKVFGFAYYRYNFPLLPNHPLYLRISILC